VARPVQPAEQHATLSACLRRGSRRAEDDRPVASPAAADPSSTVATMVPACARRPTNSGRSDSTSERRGRRGLRHGEIDAPPTSEFRPAAFHERTAFLRSQRPVELRRDAKVPTQPALVLMFRPYGSSVADDRLRRLESDEGTRDSTLRRPERSQFRVVRRRQSPCRGRSGDNHRPAETVSAATSSATAPSCVAGSRPKETKAAGMSRDRGDPSTRAAACEALASSSRS